MAQSVGALKVVSEYLVRHCPKAQRAEFAKIVASPSTGLLLNERMVR
jgi:hypothetical protein